MSARGAAGRLRRMRDEWRLSAITLGAPAFPLVVLFGLNAVDELDRTAFAVLLPDIRDHFGLSDAGALAMVAASTVAVLLIEVPLSFYCDRRNRVRIAATGAALWAVFSVGNGLAVSVAMLVAMRIGAGGGRAVVTPTHSSLLSDFYEPSARVIYALISLVAPPRVRSAAFSTMSVFAIPGIAVFLPLIGAVSDSLGIQASMIVMVPVSLAAGLVLGSAHRFVREDIDAVRLESLAQVSAMQDAADQTIA